MPDFLIRRRDESLHIDENDEPLYCNFKLYSEYNLSRRFEAALADIQIESIAFS